LAALHLLRRAQACADVLRERACLSVEHACAGVASTLSGLAQPKACLPVEYACAGLVFTSSGFAQPGYVYRSSTPARAWHLPEAAAEACLPVKYICTGVASPLNGSRGMPVVE
jgi:hypothetical protein